MVMISLQNNVTGEDPGSYHTITYYTLYYTNTILYHTIPYYILYYTIPYHVWHTILYTIPYHNILYTILLLYYTIPYTIIHYTITVLYHTIHYYTLYYTTLHPPATVVRKISILWFIECKNPTNRAGWASKSSNVQTLPVRGSESYFKFKPSKKKN
jgi:hypothetical protein